MIIITDRGSKEWDKLFWRHFGNSILKQWMKNHFVEMSLQISVYLLFLFIYNNLIFWFWEKYMRICDSVCENRCRMKENVLFEAVAMQNARSISLHSMPLSRWNSTRNEKKTAEVGYSVQSLSREAIEHFFDLGVHCYCKDLEIVMACIFFSISNYKWIAWHCQGNA